MKILGLLTLFSFGLGFIIFIFGAFLFVLPTRWDDERVIMAVRISIGMFLIGTISGLILVAKLLIEACL